MAYKFPALPPVYNEIGSLVFGESSVHADISLTGRLLVTLADDEHNFSSVSLSHTDVSTLINFLSDMQKSMRVADLPANRR